MVVVEFDEARLTVGWNVTRRFLGGLVGSLSWSSSGTEVEKRDWGLEGEGCCLGERFEVLVVEARELANVGEV